MYFPAHPPRERALQTYHVTGQWRRDGLHEEGGEELPLNDLVAAKGNIEVVHTRLVREKRISQQWNNLEDHTKMDEGRA